MYHPMLIPKWACLIPYGRGGVAGGEAEVTVTAGAVFGLIGTHGGNQITWLRKSEVKNA